MGCLKGSLGFTYVKLAVGRARVDMAEFEYRIGENFVTSVRLRIKLQPERMSLKDVVFNYPAVDNHAHPLLKEEHRRSLPFEGAISEAGPDAIKDAIHSLPGYRATRQLAELYGLDPEADWEEIKNHRDALGYAQLCNMNMRKAGIQSVLLDDGLSGVQEMANDLNWHGRFTNGSVYRLVRVEPVAEVRDWYPQTHWCGIDGVAKGHPEIPLPDRSKLVS